MMALVISRAYYVDHSLKRSELWFPVETMVCLQPPSSGLADTGVASEVLFKAGIFQTSQLKEDEKKEKRKKERRESHPQRDHKCRDVCVCVWKSVWKKHKGK